MCVCVCVLKYAVIEMNGSKCALECRLQRPQRTESVNIISSIYLYFPPSSQLVYQ